MPQLVERPGFCDSQQPQRRVRRAGLLLGLCRGQRAPGPARPVGCQLCGALTQCGGRRQAAAGTRPGYRALEFGGDVLIKPGRCARAMPSATVGIDAGVGGLGQGAVRAVALLR